MSTGTDFGNSYKNYEHTDDLEKLQNITGDIREGINNATENVENKAGEEVVKETDVSAASTSGISSNSGMAVQSKRKRFICDICRKSYCTKRDLSRHLNIHYNDRPFKCSVCCKSFKLERYKMVHELRHFKRQIEIEGDERTKKLHICNICKNRFSTRKSLSQHTNLHKKKYLCNFCGKRCGSKYNLEKHLRIHTNKKPFSCGVCKRKFSQTAHYLGITVHIMKIITFTCDICDKKFKTLKQRNEHKLYHFKKKII